MVERPRQFSSWWLDRRLRSKGLAVLAPPVMVLVIIVAVSFIVERYQVAFGQATSAANAMALQSAEVLTQLLNAETGVRGYAATTNTHFLAPYHTATEVLPGELDRLVDIAPTPAAVVNAQNVNTLATKEPVGLLPQLATIMNGVAGDTLSPDQLDTALTNEDSQMGSLRTSLTNILTTERATAAAKGHDSARLQSAIQPAQIVGLLVGVLGGLVAMVLFVRSIVRRMGQVGANARRLGVGEPLASMPAAADEVGQLDEELRQTSTLLTQRSTDLVRAHASAVEAAATADELLSRTNHELRTPLTAVMGFGQLIDTSELSEPNSESVQQMLQASNHMLRIIEEGRTPAAAQEEFDLDLRPVKIGPLVDEVRLLLSPLSDDRHLTVTGCDDTPVAVIADYHRFKQVLINLLSNAVKYNRDRGQISITCQTRDNQTVRVAVSDTGEGIPPDLMNRVFVPFDRLGAELRGIEGTGIGLSLSKTFVEAMHGAIGVESTEGKGSTFWVDLPSAPNQAGPDSLDTTAP